MRNLLGVVGACGLCLVVSCSSDSGSKGTTANGGQGGSGASGGGSSGSAGSGGAGATAGSTGMGGTAGAGATAGASVGGTSGSGGAAGEPDTTGDAGAPPLSPDVSGTLIDGLGVPISAAPIEIGGTIAVTDSSGAFTVPNVAPQYDAYIVSAGTQEVFIYEGLTTRSPGFQVFGVAPNNRTASVNGRIAGGAGFPTPANHKLLVGADSSPNLYGLGGSTGPGPDYELTDMAWEGPATLQLNVSALQFSVDSKGLPVAYDGQASKQVAITDGQTVGKTDGSTAATNLTLTAVTARTLTGALSAFPDCKLSTEVYTNSGTILTDAPTGTSYSYVLPSSITGSTGYMTIFGRCAWTNEGPSTKSSMMSLAVGAPNTLDITLRNPPALSLPIQNATGITSATPFRWAPGDDVLRYVQFQMPNWTINRIGVTSGTTFPDLSRFGIALPKAAVVTWTAAAVGVSGAKSIPEDFFKTFAFPVPAGQFASYANSETWSFTTAP